MFSVLPMLSMDMKFLGNFCWILILSFSTNSFYRIWILRRSAVITEVEVTAWPRDIEKYYCFFSSSLKLVFVFTNQRWLGWKLRNWNKIKNYTWNWIPLVESIIWTGQCALHIAKNWVKSWQRFVLYDV